MCQKLNQHKIQLHNTFDTVRQLGYRQYKNKVKIFSKNNFVVLFFEIYMTLRMSKNRQSNFGIESAKNYVKRLR